MKEKDVQKVLWEHWKSHDLQFLNTYLFRNGWGESDYVSVLSSGYCYEVEVKVSRSDFFADFKKIKHKFIERILDKRDICCKFGQEYHKWRESGEDVLYDEMCKGKIKRRVGRGHPKWPEKAEYTVEAVGSYLMWYEDLSKHSPNKFFFAVPEGLVSPEEVPDYAGLIYIVGSSAEIIKPPKFLHRNKINIKEKVFKKMYYTYKELMEQKMKAL